LDGGVSSSSGKGKKPPKAPRVDRTLQSIRTLTKFPKNLLHVLGKLLLPKLIQKKHDLDQPALKRQMKLFLKDLRDRGFNEDAQRRVVDHLINEEGYYLTLLKFCGGLCLK
jgi:hypothetical protein